MRSLVAGFVTALVLAGAVGEAADLRFMTLNTHTVGSPGSDEYDALVRLVGRICPEVAVIQEVTDSEDAVNVADLAEDAGFVDYAVSGTSGTMAYDIRTACLSDYPIADSESWSAAEASGDPDANDICRDIFACRLQLPGGGNLIAITVHLKAYMEDIDRFRKMIEAIRTGQVVDHCRAAYPQDRIVVAGDFNEDIDWAPWDDLTWTSEPSGLPYSYRLGDDITFPLVYNPFAPLLDRGLVMIEATWEDTTSSYATYPYYASRIDYVFCDPALPVVGDEVYYSVRDNGADDPPAGNWLAKCGTVPPSGTSMDASDHLAVFADLEYSGGPEPTPTPPPSPTATPTPFGTPPATATPAPTATTAPEILGVRLEMNAALFRAGDPFHLGLSTWNTAPEWRSQPLFVILDVAGQYWFWPSWGREPDYEPCDLPPHSQALDTPLLDFVWPAGAGRMADLRFWAALTSADLGSIVGQYDVVEWGFE